MKRFIPLMIAFVLGVAACWVFRDSREVAASKAKQEPITPAIDFTQDFYLHRTHTKDDSGTSGRFKPYRFIVGDGKPTELAPVPPEDDRWMLELTAPDGQHKIRVYAIRED